MAFNQTINAENSESVGTAAATVTTFVIWYDAVDITVDTASVRIGYGISAKAAVATGATAPTTNYATIPAGVMVTKYNPHKDGKLPWRLMVWDTTATAVVSLQGVQFKRKQ